MDLREVSKRVDSKWREVIDTYSDFIDKLMAFQSIAPDIPIDFLGPGTQMVYQLRLHRKSAADVLDDIHRVRVQYGDLSIITPEQPEPTAQPDDSEQPISGKVTTDKEQSTESADGSIGVSRSPTTKRTDISGG